MEKKTCNKCGFIGNPSQFRADGRNECKDCYNKYYRKRYKKKGAKRMISEMVARLETNEKLKGWGNNKSRDFLYDYNKNRYDGADPIVDHSKFVGNIIVLPAKSNRHGRAE